MLQDGIHELSLGHESMCPGNWVHINSGRLFLSLFKYYPRTVPGWDLLIPIWKYSLASSVLSVYFSQTGITPLSDLDSLLSSMVIILLLLKYGKRRLSPPGKSRKQNHFINPIPTKTHKKRCYRSSTLISKIRISRTEAQERTGPSSDMQDSHFHKTLYGNTAQSPGSWAESIQLH